MASKLSMVRFRTRPAVTRRQRIGVSEMGGSVDFDLHGVVGIRVIDPRRLELNAIRRQLGPIERSLSGRRPDIIVRFIDDAPTNEEIRHITLGQTAHDAHAYYVLRDDQGRPTWTSLPMDAVGGPCEVVCSRGTRGIRPLLAIINLTALWKGLVPVHGSALVHSGRGILVTGWAKGGKTETLLAFREHGAKYLADEWVYLDPETQRMYGIPEPIRLWEWHLRTTPSLRPTVASSTWLRLQVGGGVAAIVDRLAAAAGQNRSGLAWIARKASPSLRRQLSVRVPPERLFGSAQIATGGVQAGCILWAVSHARQQITVDSTDAAVVAQRMAYSVEYELADLHDHYLQFRYAFPDATNARIDEMRPRLQQLLGDAMSRLAAYRVAHPYPVDLGALYAAVESRLAEDLIADA